MSVRGLSSAHRQPLIETVFATDPLQWTERPIRWPLWVRLPFIAIMSGLCWALVLVFAFMVAGVLRSI